METLEFPRLVYKSAAEHILVNDADEYDAAIKDGWFGSVPETSGNKDAGDIDKLQSDADADAKHLALVEEALALGLKVTKVWGNAKLQAAIDAAKDAK